MTQRITDALRDLAVPIDSVRPHPTNPREGDIGAICTSLSRFGQVRPIVVQESTGLVVAGNHVLAAAKALNWQTIAAHVVAMTDEEADAYLLADNRLSELGSYDDALLRDVLATQARAGNLTGTGYDGDDVDDAVLQTASTKHIVMENVKVSDVVTWDDAGQKAAWGRFVKWLAREMEGEDTPARLDAFLLWQADR